MIDGILFVMPILAYFGILFVVARRSMGKGGDSSDQSYFLAGRGLGSFYAVLSVVATETSVATIVIFPGAGMSGGLSLFWLLPGYIFGRTLVAFFYLKKLYEMETLSLYDTMSGGGPAARSMLSAAYLLAKFISSGVRLFLGAFALNQLFSGGVLLWLLLIVGIVGAYSLTGGLKAVVYTDQLQGWIILFMGLLFLVLLAGDGARFHPEQISFVNFNFAMGNSLNSIGLLAGGLVLSIGTHGADQDMIQRILGTRSLREARRSLILSGAGASVVILLYLSIGILLGDLPGNYNNRSPLVDYISLGGNPLLSGLFAVLLIAAAMSTLDSAIHSTGAVWKGLFRSGRSGRFWSLVSLMILPAFAIGFIEIEKHYKDLLGLAMGSMNYVNGGLIGILSHSVFFPGRGGFYSVLGGLGAGFGITVFLTWGISPAMAWTWIVLLSSGGAFLFAILGGMLAEVTE